MRTQPNLGKQEEHAFFIVFLAFLLTIFWYATWEIIGDGVSWIEQKYGITRWKIHVGMLVGILGLIALFPQMLDRL